MSAGYERGLELDPMQDAYGIVCPWYRLQVPLSLVAALADINEAVRIFPSSAQARLYRGNIVGMIAHERGKVKVRGDWYTLGWFSPPHHKPWIGSCRQYLSTADKEVGLALHSEPRLLPALELRAGFRLRRAAFKEAVRDLTALVALSPGTSRAWMQLGVLQLTRLRQPRAAALSFTRALGCNGHTHRYRAHLLRAQAYVQQHRFEEAAVDCRKCV